MNFASSLYVIPLNVIVSVHHMDNAATEITKHFILTYEKYFDFIYLSSYPQLSFENLY